MAMGVIREFLMETRYIAYHWKVKRDNDSKMLKAWL